MVAVSRKKKFRFVEGGISRRSRATAARNRCHVGRFEKSWSAKSNDLHLAIASSSFVAFSIHRRTVPSFSSSPRPRTLEQNRRWIRTVRSCYRLTVNYNLTHEKKTFARSGPLPAPPLLRDSLSRDQALISTSCSLYTGCSRWIIEIDDRATRNCDASLILIFSASKYIDNWIEISPVKLLERFFIQETDSPKILITDK